MGLTTRRSLPSDFYGYDMSTTTRGGVSCASTDLKNHLPLLNPKFLRYPSGSTANWWDWKIGWYVNSPYLPEWDQNKTQTPNKLEDFKGLLTAAGATALFDLNLLTSDVKDQIAMLQHAESIGIPVKYIELGNEFYLEGDGADDTALILIKYPTPESYRDTANIWMDSLRKYFPNAKIAAQGCFDKNNNPRRNAWNDAVIPGLDGENAITFHFYYSSKFADSTETDAQKMDVNMSDIPDWFYQPYKAWGILHDKSLVKVPAGQEIWITEYNFADHVRPVHGTWASGLYTALHSMQLMQDDRIQHISLHGVDGQAVYGAYFYGTDGYLFGLGDDANFVAPPNPPVTEAWALNAYGHTMTMMGNAITNKLYASRIQFTSNPQISTFDDGKTVSYDGLFGYEFSDATKSQAIIVNLTGVDQTVKTSVMFPLGGSYEMRSAGVLNLIATSNDVVITNKSTLPANLVLKPYSITRISANTVPLPPPTTTITANGSLNLCEGDSVQLNGGTGFYSYLWSTGATTQKIWVKETGDYWVHVYAVNGGYYGIDTIHVTVNPVPKDANILLDGTKEFCAGGSVGISLAPAYDPSGLTLYWPATGSTNSSITVTTSGSYYLLLTNAYGCIAHSDTEVITVHPLPTPVVTAVGPSAACYNVDVTLKATLGYVSYQWSNGSWGQTQIFQTSGTYTVDAKDANGCHGISNPFSLTVWDLPVPTVSAVGPTTYCGGSGSSYLTTPNTGYAYNWLKGSVVQAGATGQTFTPSVNGTYKVKITDTHGCNKTSSSGVSVTINKTPTVSLTINGSTNICNGQTRTLTATANGGSGFTYKWKKNGSNISGATNKTYVCSIAGSFSCTVTNSLGCSATSNTMITTTNCKEGESMVSAPENVSWLVYPNPATYQLHVQLHLANHEKGNAVIQVRNLLGAIISEQEQSYSEYQVATDLSLDASLPNGMYFVIVKSEDGMYHTSFEIGK